MGPVVEATQRVPANRIVPGDLTSAVFEDRKDVSADLCGSDRIEQDLHWQAGCRLRRQRFSERAAYLAGPVDVRLDRDRGLCFSNGLEHRGVERIAIVQNLERVPVDEQAAARAGHRSSKAGLGDRELVIQSIVRRLRRRCGEIRQNRHGAEQNRNPARGRVDHGPHTQHCPRPPRPGQTPEPVPCRQQPSRPVSLPVACSIRQSEASTRQADGSSVSAPRRVCQRQSAWPVA